MGSTCSAKVTRPDHDGLTDSCRLEDAITVVSPSSNNSSSTRNNMMKKRKAKRLSFDKKVSMIVDYYLRKYTSEMDDDHQQNCIKMITKYCDWVEYPEGDHILKKHKSSVLCASVSNNGRYLFSGSEDKSVICWDLSRNAKMNHWIAHSGSVMCLASECDGQVISGGSDASIRVWKRNLITDIFDLMHTLDAHTASVTSVKSMSDDGITRVISGSADNTIRVWCLQSGECMSVLSGHSSMITSVLVLMKSTKMTSLVSGSTDKSVILWDDNSVMNRNTLSDEVRDLSMNSDGSLLACVTGDEIMIMECSSSSSSLTEVSRVIPLKNVSCAEFHPVYPSVLAVAMDDDHSIKLLSVSENNTFEEGCICAMHGHSSVITDMCFTIPNGDQLMTVSHDHSVRVWDVSLILNCLREAGELSID